MAGVVNMGYFCNASILCSMVMILVKMVLVVKAMVKLFSKMIKTII